MNLYEKPKVLNRLDYLSERVIPQDKEPFLNIVYGLMENVDNFLLIKFEDLTSLMIHFTKLDNTDFLNLIEHYTTNIYSIQNKGKNDYYFINFIDK